MYNEFDKKGIKVNVHIHDRNMSVNKAIKSKEYVITKHADCRFTFRL